MSRVANWLDRGNCRYGLAAATLSVVFAAAACGGGPPAASSAATDSATSGAKPEPVKQQDDPLPPSELETQLPDAVRDAVLKPFTGDFDEMLVRRGVRVGVTFDRSFYFIDKRVLALILESCL